jgi:CRP/FNR family transcriptional regulator
MELAGFDFYSMLGEKSKEYLNEVLKPIEAPKGTILFFQGDICEDILLLSHGELRLFIQGEEADIITLYHLKEGEQCIVNTSSAISSSPAIATAETMSDISGWLLPRSSVKTLMRDNDLYQDFIFSLFTIKLSSLAEIIEDIKFVRLEDRLIKWFKKQEETKLKITHEGLALELGSSRVVISRVLKLLEQQNKISLHRGYIKINSM